MIWAIVTWIVICLLIGMVRLFGWAASALLVVWLLMVLVGVTLWLPLVVIALIPGWTALALMNSSDEARG